MKIQVPEKLEPFLTKKKRFKVAFGGRGGAKSQSFADMLIVSAQANGEKVGCFREYQNSIDDSVYALLKEEIGRTEAPGYTVNRTSIDNVSGGGFRFRGLSRSPDSVKSMYGFKKFWIEEAQSISNESLKLLTPTLRESESEAWFSLNPKSSADPISQRFIEPFKASLDRDGYYEDDLHLIVKINYTDNPWFPATLDQERIFDLNNKSRADYDHIWLGAYDDNIEGSIILAEWFDAAVDAHKKLGFEPLGKKVASHDPSDEGKDDKAVVVRHGSVITHADVLKTGDSAEGIAWALGLAVTEQADLFVWDCDGLGVSLKAEVKRALKGKKIDYAMFKGSESPDNPDSYYDGEFGMDKTKQRTNKQVFRNKRAQHYWGLRDRFYNTYRAVVKGEYIPVDMLISVSSDIRAIQNLKSEICRIPKKHNSNGFIQIMSKEEMRRLKINSPNLSDSAMMSMFIGEEEYAGQQVHIPHTGSWMAA